MRKYPFSLLQKALIAVIVILLPATFIIAYNYYENRDYQKEIVLNNLSLIAEAFEGQVYQFLELSRRRVEDFASDGTVRDYLQEIVDGHDPAVKSLSAYLSSHQHHMDKSIRIINVVSLSGRILVSTEPSEIGEDIPGEVFIARGKERYTVFEGKSDSPVLPEIIVSAPVFSKSTGMPIGLVSNRLFLSELNSLLKGEFRRDRGAVSWNKGRRKTLDIYLVNEDKLMITDSIFIEDAVLRQVVDTQPVLECLNSNTEVTAFYRDYRGVEVAGASVCLPAMKWTLVAEIDEVEALAHVTEMQENALITVMAIASLIFVLFLLFFRGVIVPLRRITGAAEEVAGGNYDIVIPVKTKDEMGILTSSFNKMAHEINQRTMLLRESEERLKAMIDNSMTVIFLKNTEGRYILVNPRFESFVNLKSEEVIGRTDHDIFPEELADMLRANELRVLESRTPMEFEEVIAKDDGMHYCLAMKFPICDSTGTPIAVCGICVDITDRKLSEKKIARLNRIYSVLSKINEAIVRIRDRDKLYEQACRISVEDGHFLMAWLGLIDPSNLLVKPVAYWGAGASSYLDDIRISVNSDSPEGREPAGTAIREERSFICNDIMHDPNMSVWRDKALSLGYRSSAAFPVRLGGQLIGTLNFYSAEPHFFDDDEVALLEALAADISFAVESIETERQVRDADEERHLLQSISLTVSKAEDFHSALTVATTGVCKATGWSMGEIWIPHSDEQKLECVSAWQNSDNGLEKFINFSHGITFPPGIGLPGRVWASKKPEWIKDVSINNSVFLRADIAVEAGLKAGLGVPIIAGNQVLAILVFFMSGAREEDRRMVDLISAVAGRLGSVFQHKIAEEARFELQQRFGELVNNLPVGVYRHNSDGQLIEFNQATFKLSEADSQEDLLRHNISDFFENKRRYRELIDKTLKHGSLKGEEVQLVTLKGNKLWATITAVVKNDPKGNIYLDGILEDITEKKRLEAQFLQAQKMEAIGQLAGGIAHDFNNILTGIIGYGSLLRMKFGEEKQVSSYAENILNLSERAAGLTQGLLAFSRKQVIRKEVKDLNELVKRVTTLLRRVIGEDTDLQIKLTENRLLVQIDPAQIEQVLMNLATNARDAMPGGGTLTISTEFTIMPNWLEETDTMSLPGEYALIKVADTGIGIDKNTRERIFEPFFTTKEVGKGTGLGLSIAYGVIKQHNGYININSTPGEGTVFEIYLPITKVLSDEIVPSEIIVPRGGTETVLLAEDEAEVRGVTTALLLEFGYKVIESINGEDAVSKFMENRDSVQLLILDLVMPRKNGKDAYDEIRKIKPDMKALFISGYAFDTLRGQDIVEEGLHYISKPISPPEFLKKVREVLTQQ